MGAFRAPVRVHCELHAVDRLARPCLVNAKIVAVKDERRKSKIGTVIMPGATKSGDNQWKGDLLTPCFPW
jgi:hypothetical protein